MSVDSWEWRPGRSVGPFRFGSDANAVIERFGLCKLEPDCPGAYWETYEIPGHESRISTEGGKISSINCWDRLSYKGFDLLTLTINEARAILGPEEQAESVGEGAMAVYYNSLGLTLWTSDGKIESATCDVEQKNAGENGA